VNISIIIPTTSDRRHIFEETISAALIAVKPFDGEIIVVNDTPGYTPNIPGCENVRTLNNPGRGVASARNYGARNAVAPLLLFLDNDIITSAELVGHLINFHQYTPRACLNPNWEYPKSLLESLNTSLYGKFLLVNNMTSFKGWYNDPSWQDNACFPAKSVASFHLSIEKDLFLESGGYNESFPFAGFEDYDFPKRLQMAGFKFFIDTTITALHNESDRINIDLRIKSLNQRALTRKRAVEIGYRELALFYSPFSKVILTIIGANKNLLIGVLKLIPARTYYFNIFSKILKAIEAAAIYNGYTSKL